MVQRNVGIAMNPCASHSPALVNPPMPGNRKTPRHDSGVLMWQSDADGIPPLSFMAGRISGSSGF